MRKSLAIHQQLAADLNNGLSVRQNLLNAGYSPKQAAKGWTTVPDRAKRLLSRRTKELIRQGSTISISDQEALVRGRLVDNVVAGTDKGALSAKILGK